MVIRVFLLSVFLALASTLAPAAPSVALLTAVRGKAHVDSEDGQRPAQAFISLKAGDLLTLERDSRLTLVYFDNAREEVWQGRGKLRVGDGESIDTLGTPARVRQLPSALARQMARAPTFDSQGRAGMTRLRVIATPEAIARVEANYRQLRIESESEDLNPEIYLLSSLLELRQLDRLEHVLQELQSAHPRHPEAKLLVALYRKALRNYQEARGK